MEMMKNKKITVKSKYIKQILYWVVTYNRKNNQFRHYEDHVFDIENQAIKIERTIRLLLDEGDFIIKGNTRLIMLGSISVSEYVEKFMHDSIGDLEIYNKYKNLGMVLNGRTTLKLYFNKLFSIDYSDITSFYHLDYSKFEVADRSLIQDIYTLLFIAKYEDQIEPILVIDIKLDKERILNSMELFYSKEWKESYNYIQDHLPFVIDNWMELSEHIKATIEAILINYKIVS
ncbi:MAG: hypothetical protein ACJATI_004727 [Halioglobus sp.]|jgi:hypothetical protein